MFEIAFWMYSLDSKSQKLGSVTRNHSFIVKKGKEPKDELCLMQNVKNLLFDTKKIVDPLKGLRLLDRVTMRSFLTFNSNEKRIALVDQHPLISSTRVANKSVFLTWPLGVM